jgi:hypothetical protein
VSLDSKLFGGSEDLMIMVDWKTNKVTTMQRIKEAYVFYKWLRAYKASSITNAVKTVLRSF